MQQAGAAVGWIVVAATLVPSTMAQTPLAAVPTASARDRAMLVQTAKDTGDRLSRKAGVAFIDDFSAPITVDVSKGALDQEIAGFGGAFTEASALVFQKLNRNLQRQVLDMYFDPERGIGYTMGRVHINSCDFSVASYSFDDVPGDFSLAHFDTNVTHDQATMIPLIKLAMQKLRASDRNLRLFASPWSPPAWMKSNGQMDGSGNPGLRPDCHEVWGDYIAKWITSYKAQGIPIWAITVQNEPENVARWEACVYTPQQEADFLGQSLGPTLRAAHPEVKVFAFDHNKDHVYDWAKTMYEHSTASQYTYGIAFHWYSGDQFGNVERVHRDFPNAVLLATEATWERYRWSKGTTVQTGDWAFGEGYAHDILGDLNAGAVGWTDWNILLDQDGGPNHVGNNCDSPLMANVSSQELYIHPQYYFIGHFSKYILPGSKRVNSTIAGSRTYTGPNRGYGTCTADDGLQATAFERPDGIVVAIVLNCGGAAVEFKLKDSSRALNASIPAHAIQTYMFNRGSSTKELFV